MKLLIAVSGITVLCVGTWTVFVSGFVYGDWAMSTVSAVALITSTIAVGLIHLFGLD